MKYLVIIERTATGFSAYSPDVDGCVATAEDRDRIEAEMRKAIEFHLDSLRAEGHEVPRPTTTATFVEVAA